MGAFGGLGEDCWDSFLTKETHHEEFIPCEPSKIYQGLGHGRRLSCSGTIRAANKASRFLGWASSA